jgi:hypothetical protein
VLQGVHLDKEEVKSGSDVGYRVERVGEPGDIALAQLHDGVVFDNTFMDIVRKDGEPVTTKTLMPSKSVNMRDTFQIDRFPTDMQLLTSLGRRYQITKQVYRQGDNGYWESSFQYNSSGLTGAIDKES